MHNNFDDNEKIKIAATDLLLGFDFGTKKIGIASGQKITNTASPITTIATNNKNEPDWEAIAKIIANWKPKALIVGLPLYRDGTMSEIAILAQQFAKQLQEKFDLPVFTINERLTSKAAKERIVNSGGNKALKKHSLDAAAAAIILEEWLLNHSG